jgi:CBS domain-containing protein
MKTRVITTMPDASITQVVELMRNKKIDAVPVLDQGKLSGIIATLDIARVSREKWPEMLARDIMKKNLVITYPNETLYRALAKMTKNNISHLPVVQPNAPETIIGILTLNDIALAYSYDGRQDVSE